MIAMFLIVIMYSSAIPALYPAGCVLMIVSYWADKWLFLRHYRLPPSYGKKLAERVAWVMELGIILHLFFGLFMLSNPDIFTYENEQLLIPEWCKYYMSLMSVGAVTFFGASPERFNQVHTFIYCLGISIFLVLFAI